MDAKDHPPEHGGHGHRFGRRSFLAGAAGLSAGAMLARAPIPARAAPTAEGLHGVPLRGMFLTNRNRLAEGRFGAMFSGDAPETSIDEDGIPTNKLGQRYPRVIDPRTGQNIPFPEGPLSLVPPEQRTKYDRGRDRAKFIAEWQERGYPRAPNNWDGDLTEVHHIRPLKRGGTNDFWNLVPLPIEVHRQFTDYWRSY